MRVVAICCVVLSFTSGKVSAAISDEYPLSQSEMNAETNWLTSLGLKPPMNGSLLEKPWAQPLSRRSFLVPTAWYRDHIYSNTVNAAALAQDIPLLSELMEKSQSGWEVAAMKGWNWQDFFTRWQSLLLSYGDANVPVEKAFSPYSEYAEFQLENHSGPQLGGVSYQSGSRSAIALIGNGFGKAVPICDVMRNSDNVEFNLLANDRSQQLRWKQVFDPTSGKFNKIAFFSYPSRRGSVSSIHCGIWYTAKPAYDPPYKNRIQEILNLEGGSQDIASFRQINNELGYLRLPTFDISTATRLSHYKTWLPQDAAKVTTLIVDLRSNDGGNGSPALPLLGEFIDLQASLPAINPAWTFKKSCLTWGLVWGFVQLDTSDIKPPLSSDVKQYMQAGLDAIGGEDKNCDVIFETQPSSWRYDQHQFPTQPTQGRPRIVVLIDNYCGSDCEYIANVLASVKGSVIVGTNTYGVMQFVRPGYTILPHSRVMFRLATGTLDLFSDNRSADGYGLDIDVLLDTEESQSAASVLKLVGKLK